MDENVDDLVNTDAPNASLVLISSAAWDILPDKAASGLSTFPHDARWEVSVDSASEPSASDARVPVPITLYVAGPTMHAHVFCHLIDEAPGVRATTLPAPEEWANVSPSRLPLFATAAALLLISFGNSDLLRTWLSAIADLPSTITPPHIGLITSGVDAGEIETALDRGIDIFISANETLSSLYCGITAALNGLPFCSLLLQPLVAATRRSTTAKCGACTVPATDVSAIPNLPRLPILTSREWEVAEMIVQGYSDGEAAARLFISVATLKTHLRAIYHKLSIERRGQLPAVLGRVPPSERDIKPALVTSTKKCRKVAKYHPFG